MKHNLIGSALTIGCLSLATAGQAATVINFDSASYVSTGAGFSNIYTENGFTLDGSIRSFNAQTFAHVDIVGTPYSGQLNISQTNGNPFYMTGFDLPYTLNGLVDALTSTEYPYNYVTVTGTQASTNTTYTVSFNPSTAPIPVLPSAFTTGLGLSSVVFSSSAPPSNLPASVSYMGDSYFWVDNIQVAAVPIPGSGAMAGLGLLGLMGASRLRKSKT